MPSKVENDYATGAYGYSYPRRTLYYTWNRSPRLNGVLQLQPNAMSRTEQRVRLLSHRSRNVVNDGRQAVYGNSRLFGSPQTIDSGFNTHVTNRAYARLKAEIRGDTAALGMTLSTWKQSWSMIGLRAGQIWKIANRAEKTAGKQRLRASKQRRGQLRGSLLVPKSSADIFLEGIFGWLPLLEDIYNALKVIAGDIPAGWVKGRARDRKILRVSGNPVVKYQGITLDCRCVMTALVRIDNPNLWLLNKLGLVNPATVLWDRVPWSFLVNEFVNLNAIAESYTDFLGLTLEKASTTTAWRYVEASTLQSGYSTTDPSYLIENRIFDDTFKTRSLGLTLPSLEFKLPQVNMTSALIKLSLMTQQVARLTK